MRIGEFSEKHNVTKDTIRHYIDLELIIPKRKGTHFFFDNKCSDDLLEILKLKDLGFSLKEIQKIIVFNRLSGTNKTEEDESYILSILNDKYNLLNNELEHLKNSITNLENLINNSEQVKKTSKTIKLGLPLQWINLLSCPICGESLSFSDGIIEKDLIMKGNIFCSGCSFNSHIDDGIIINLTEEDKIIKQSVPFDDSSSLGDYTVKTPSKFINFMYRAIDWMIDNTNLTNISHNPILELGTGSGFFLRQILNTLDSKTLYIITDINLSRIKRIKEQLELSGLHKNFMFICSDFLNLPFKKDSMELIIDYLGSTCYNFEKRGFLFDSLNDLLKKDGLWTGCYYSISSNTKSIKLLPQEVREFFYEENIDKSIRNSKLKLIAEDYLGTVDDVGEYESFLVSGDELHQKLALLSKR